jgi:hypothetical protein
MAPKRGDRTTIVTTVAIAAVLVTSGAAIAANLGILRSTTDTKFGELTAADTSTAAASGDDDASPAAPSATTQTFDVDEAGSVTLSRTYEGLRLDRVTAADDWTWEVVSATDAKIVVRFANGRRLLDLVAMGNEDGLISADVVESSSTTPPPVRTGRPDDSEEHEGRDDDD